MRRWIAYFKLHGFIPINRLSHISSVSLLIDKQNIFSLWLAFLSYACPLLRVLLFVIYSLRELLNQASGLSPP